MRIRVPSPTIASATGKSMAAFAGRSFWAKTRTATTDIHEMLMALTATSTSMSAILEPRQQSLYSNPEPALARQSLRKVLLERCELVDTCRDHKRASGPRPVRPGQCKHDDAHESPEGKVRPYE